MIVVAGKTVTERFTSIADSVAEKLDDIDNAYHEMYEFVTEEYSNFNATERDHLSTTLHRLSSMRGLRKTLLAGLLEFRVALRKKEKKETNLIMKGRSKYE